MKQLSIKLATLLLFFATGGAIGMEAPQKLIIQNEAWGYEIGGYYYDIKVSINDSNEEIQIKGDTSYTLGNLNDINQITIRRSGALSWLSPYSYVTQEQLNMFKEEANDPANIGKDLFLVIGSIGTKFGIYKSIWARTTVIGQDLMKIDKNNPWSLFPNAEKAKNNLNVDFFDTREQRSKLVTVAKLVLGFNANDNPTESNIKKKYFQLSKQFHPDKTSGQMDLSASVSFDSFTNEVSKIIGRAYEILKQQ